ncbi:MAG TPA: universal stress protein [Dongiaceae bacterium]|nr:universal stress protein [Dongiaceae bacterium]
MTNKILCAVDGSVEADHAAACATDLAKETGALLTFVNVNVMARGRLAHDGFWDEMRLEAPDVQGHALLGHLADYAQSHGVDRFNSVVISGDRVYAALLSYAESKGYDHIVVGSHITNGLRRLIEGSTASDLVMRAHCPVTVVH